MKLLTLTLLLAAGLTLSSVTLAENQPRTALDLAQILVQSQGQIDQGTITELLTGGIAANMRVPPEHLGVAFWNKQTGQRLDRRQGPTGKGGGVSGRVPN